MGKTPKCRLRSLNLNVGRCKPRLLKMGGCMPRSLDVGDMYRPRALAVGRLWTVIVGLGRLEVGRCRPRSLKWGGGVCNVCKFCLEH